MALRRSCPSFTRPQRFRPCRAGLGLAPAIPTRAHVGRLTSTPARRAGVRAAAAILGLALLAVNGIPSAESHLVESAAGHQARGPGRRLQAGALPPLPQRYSASRFILTKGPGRCLDGSRPAYFFREGSGSGANSFIIQLQGGGWCTTWEDCIIRSQQYLGSSRSFVRFEEKRSDAAEHPGNGAGQPLYSGAGLYSNDPRQNPDFHNWNLAFVLYCDGGARLGTRGRVQSRRHNHTLVFGGQRALNQVIRDLKKHRGLRRAESVLVSGSSAGGQGLAVLCDWLADRLPGKATKKCLSDGGFFLDFKDSSGGYSFDSRMRNMGGLHKALRSTPSKCREANPEEWRCLMPEYVLAYVQTPFFIVNDVLDSVALSYVYHNAPVNQVKTPAQVVACRDGESFGDERPCPAKTRAAYLAYGYQMTYSLEILAAVAGSPKKFGYHLTNKGWHLHAGTQHWNTPTSGWMSAREAVADWFFDR